MVQTSVQNLTSKILTPNLKITEFHKRNRKIKIISKHFQQKSEKFRNFQPNRNFGLNIPQL